MAIPVYVQSVATYPGRTAWDTTGATNYAVGDRVYYDDGTLEKVYVCIVGNTSTTTPDNDSTNWVLAGSKEYPFLSGSNGGLWSTGYSNTELCLRYDGGFNTQWDPARTLSISDGSTRAHVILMDGVFELNENTNYSNTDFYAENFQKAFLVQRYYDHSSTTNRENCPTFNNLKLGLLNNNASFESPLVLNNCLVTTKTPLGNKIKTLHRFQYQDFIKATDCLFDFSLCDNNNFIAGESSGPSALHGPTSFKNCTIIFNKGENQYGGLMYAGHSSAYTIIDNCIFYFLGQVEQSQPKVVSHSNITVTNTCVFAESFSDQPFIAGISSVDDSNHLNVNPLFIDPAGGDYRLRPSSPLIGGQTDSLTFLEAQYPNSVWYDSSATSGGDGSKESPFDVFLSAIQASSTHTVLIKNGTHTLGQQIIDTGGSPVTLVGESTDAILFFQGGSGYGYINTSQGGNSDLLTLKNLSFRYNGGSVYGIFNTKDLTASECKFSMTDNALSAGADNRGWFTGVKGGPAETLRLSRCEISGNAINGVSGASLISGGDTHQSCFSYIYICDCTIVSEGSDTSSFYFQFSPTEFELKNTIHVGFDGTETLGKNPTVGSGNIYFNTNITPVLPKDSSSIDPNFVGSGDYRLRPSSAAIGGIKAEDNSSVWVTNTAGTGGTGTEEDPYYFGSLDQAYTDAGSFGSIVFKNGSYSVSGVFTFNSDTQANNVNYHAETNGGVEFTAEKILFGHSGLSVTQSLNYTGLKLISTNASVDNFLLNQSINNLVAAHVFASCHLQTNNSFLESNGTSTTPGKVIFRNSRLSKVSATYHSYLFEQRNGNTTPADLSFENCIIENSLSTSNLTKIFRRITATLKSTIIIDYSNSATALAVDPVPVNLVGSNCITHGDGTDLYPNESNIVVDPLFVDPAGGNFSLRPNSPLIGQG